MNVCNVMPVPAERHLVIQYCRNKLKDNGKIFWYTQHRDPDYVERCTPEVKIGDGYYMHETNRYQTFYRDFYPYEIDEIFFANGCRFVKRHDSSYQARVYRKVASNPLASILDGTLIRKYVDGDKEIDYPKKAGIRSLSTDEISKINIPNPDDLKEEILYQNALKKLPSGKKYQSEYHNLIAAIMLRLFSPILKNAKLEYDINDGRKRIDIVLSNTQESGFFKDLSNRFNVKAPYVFIECKNYTSKIRNQEIDQLAQRFKEKYGRFGILTYRKHENETNVLELCRDSANNNNIIICLNDRDLISLLNSHINNGDINELMEDKLSDVILV